MILNVSLLKYKKLLIKKLCFMFIIILIKKYIIISYKIEKYKLFLKYKLN